jgi:predicted nuclease with TOPRIM domain
MRQERSLYRQKSREHEKLREDLARVSAERDALIEQLKDLQKYESYLEDVVHLEGDSSFEETWDLLNRHKTLKSANADLMQQVSKKERARAWDGGWSGLRRRRRRRRRQLQLLLLIIIMTIVAR